jgi:hypothetical protein
MVLALAGASVLVVAPLPQRAGAEGCSTQVRVRARLDTDAAALFAAYGDDNTTLDDWTGADGSYSVTLPDGRVAWIWSDGFLGRVNEDGSRPLDAPFVNNSIVLQEGSSLTTTLHGGTEEQPTTLIVPTDGSDWYWPQEGVVEGDVLRVFLQGFVRTGPDPFDFEWTGNDIATFSLPDLSLVGVEAAPSENHVMYGAAVVEQGGFTYVYGVEDRPFVNYLHLARATGGVTGAWEYQGPDGWSPDPADSMRLLENVGNGFSVTPFRGRFVLVTFQDSDFFGTQIVAHVACSFEGPWGPEIPVYRASEHGGGLVTYNAHAHEGRARDGGLLLTYDVNTLRAQDLWRDVTIYRPRFLSLSLRP